MKNVVIQCLAWKFLSGRLDSIFVFKISSSSSLTILKEWLYLVLALNVLNNPESASGSEKLEKRHIFPMEPNLSNFVGV